CGETFLQNVFGPLGYEIEATRHPLDDHFPEWGESPYFSVELRGMVRLSELLTTSGTLPLCEYEPFHCGARQPSVRPSGPWYPQNDHVPAAGYLSIYDCRLPALS